MDRKLVNMTITMTEEDRKVIKLMAVKKDMSVSALIRKWILEKMEEEKD